MIAQIIELITLVDGVPTNVVTGSNRIDFTVNGRNLSSNTITVRCEVGYYGTIVFNSSKTVLASQNFSFSGTFWKTFTENTLLTANSYYRLNGIEYGPDDMESVMLYYQQVPIGFSDLNISQFIKV